jgi:hypothetical protein
MVPPRYRAPIPVLDERRNRCALTIDARIPRGPAMVVHCARAHLVCVGNRHDRGLGYQSTFFPTFLIRCGIDKHCIAACMGVHPLSPHFLGVLGSGRDDPGDHESAGRAQVRLPLSFALQGRFTNERWVA